jgi:hypothetical protein
MRPTLPLTVDPSTPDLTGGAPLTVAAGRDPT